MPPGAQTAIQPVIEVITSWGVSIMIRAFPFAVAAIIYEFAPWNGRFNKSQTFGTIMGFVFLISTILVISDRMALVPPLCK